MFAVVRFVEDNSVTVVSTAWFADEKTVRWPGSRNLSAYHKLLLAHEAIPPNTPQYSDSYIDARAVERETVEQSSDATSDCTKKAVSKPHLSTSSIGRVPLRYSSDDDCDHQEEKKGGSCHAPTMYPEPPPPHLPQPTMFHSPQRSPIAVLSTVRLPAFHDEPPILLPKEAAFQ
ncbi:hypothetical protein EG68_04197 [Paragonimus skrjabini miyazakii]|uniref:Uncharacterized protein n=1 Tax=Paragonimus skrjabini miyazakii TaxID=59628 RepID=A0A8S9YZQ9_9TREM|nr:hypothetical protein EG68_04197 [Paragonimus skrjabini miyazakii]